MSGRRSAFNVFRSKEKSRKSVESVGEDLRVSDETPSKKFKTAASSPAPSILSDSGVYVGGGEPGAPKRPLQVPVVSQADSSKPPKHTGKSDVLSRSIRKSFRIRTQKDHHDVPLMPSKETKMQKAGSLLQVFDKPDLLEATKAFGPSTSLEEIFLPGIAADHRNFELRVAKSESELHCDAIQNKESKKRSTTLQPSTLSPKLNRLKLVQVDSPSLTIPPASPMRQRPSLTKSGRNHLHVVNDLQKVTTATKLFEWLIGPITIDQFFRDVWEKKPLFLKRHQPKYNSGWFSTNDLDTILKGHHLDYTKNIDVAVYRDGKRHTLNPQGRAHGPQVWKFYEEGCSIRLLNPQTYSDSLWMLCSKLQEYFGCFVGANIYLTPPGSQGFAPHYDDIEAFIIQLEGKKHWRLYNSRDVNEILPRTSSGNLKLEEIGEPILDRVLEPGDTLYFPRGVIHQGCTTSDAHSLHVTVSIYQKSSWADFLEKLIPRALELAIEEDLDFRKGLPVGYLEHVGVMHSDKSSTERSAFLKTVEGLMKKLVSFLPVDATADQMAVDAIEEQLPPFLSDEEQECSVFGNGAFWNEGRVRGQTALKEDSQVRLVRPGIARLVYGEDKAVVYHSMENARVYKGNAVQVLEFTMQEAEAVEVLLASFPEYVRVSELPLKSISDKIGLANRFYLHGLIRTKAPLKQDTAM